MYKLFIMLILSLITVSPALAQGNFETADCPFNNTTGYRIDCGWLTVPENHAEPDGQKILLAVAILRSPNPAPDPVIYIEGGPGGAVVPFAPLKTLTFTSILAERDVILLDQRGVGYSQPSIVCQPYTDARPFIEYGFLNEAVLSGLESCRQQLTDNGVQLEFYNSEQSAADFAALREALNIKQANFFGVFYGTRIGLLLLRNHPEGIRSMVLDSTLPPQINTFEYQAAGFEKAFTTLEEACQADLMCQMFYPNLRQQYLDTYQRLQKSPLRLEINGKTITYSGNSFAGSVYNQFSNQANMIGMAQTAGFITDVAAGEYATLTASLEPMLQDGIMLPNIGIGLAVTCNDSAPYTSFSQINALATDLPEAFRQPTPFDGIIGYQLCEYWGILSLNTAANTQFVNDVQIPVLMLQGQLDSFTPAVWAQQTTAILPNSTLVEFPTVGHVVTRESCPQLIMLSFLKNPAVKPTTTCVGEMPESPAFVLTTRATRPIVQGGAWILAVVALIGVGSMSWTFFTARIPIAWRASLRKMGGLPLVISLLAVIISILDRDTQLFPDQQLTIAQMVIPVIIAIQAAMVFSPDDEPGLEMIMALPRPLTWLVLERLGVILITQTIIAFIGAAILYITNPEQNPAALFFGWLPPALFLSGIGLYITLRTRLMIFGMVITGFLWIIFGLFSSIFQTGQIYPFPLNLIQPFLWAINVHATPETLGSDYWINRLFLTGMGIGFLTLALNEVRNAENLLLNLNERTRRKQSKIMDGFVEFKAQLVKPVETLISPIRQLWGITLYEFRMHWQRRGFKVLTLTIILTLGTALLISAGDVNTFVPGMPLLDTQPAQQQQNVKGLIITMLSTGMLIIVTTFLMPLIVVDVIPLDRQQQIEDLLHSLPFSPSVYLAGKVAGVWLTGLWSVTVGMLITGFIWWMRVGSFNVTPLLNMMLLASLPFMFINTGIAVLIGATQPTRRRSIVLMIIVMALLTAAPAEGILSILQFNRINLLLHFSGRTMESLAVMPASIPNMLNTVVIQNLLIGLFQFIVIWTLVWAWKRRS